MNFKEIIENIKTICQEELASDSGWSHIEDTYIADGANETLKKYLIEIIMNLPDLDSETKVKIIRKLSEVSNE